MRRSYGTRLLGAAFSALVLGACDSGGSQEPPPTPAITVAVGAATASVQPGASTTLAVNITRTGGYTGAVNLAAESVPAGVTIAAVTVPSGASSGTLTIAAAAGAAPTTATVTVRATGTGVSAQTATFALTVQEPPGFGLALNPATVSVQRGGTGTTAVAITRTGGFAGAVALTATGMPQGLTVAFEPAAATGATSAVTVTAAANTPVGDHTITVQGAATGMESRTATLTVAVAAAPSIGITLNPAALSVTQGASGTVAVTLVRGGGFAGAVALSAEDLPAGVTIAGGSIAAGEGTATLTVNATAAAAPGTTNVTIRGLGTGVADATATLALTVAEAGAYTLAVAPGTVSVQRGATTTATVNLTRTGGFAGAVALTATGQPAGMTVSFNPASVTNGQSTVTVATTAAVPVGNYPVTVRGATAGLADRTATLTVQVTGAGQGTGNVTFRFCEDTDLPIWVAYRNGNGPWTQVTGTATHEYSFQIDSRGGIAYVTDFSSDFDVTVQYGTVSELQAMGGASCDPGETGPTRTVTGTASGVGLTESAYITMSGGFDIVSPLFGLGIELQNVRQGPADLVGARHATTQSGTTLNRLFLQRGVTSNTVNVDFNGANSFAPATANVTIGNLGNDETMLSSMYFTAGGTVAILGVAATPAQGATRAIQGFPANVQQNGDFHLVGVSAAAPGLGAAATHSRTATHIFRTLADRTFNLGPAMSAVTPSVLASQPYARIRLSYTVQPEYNTWYTAVFNQDDRSVTTQMSAGYLAGSTSLAIEVPDFSGVSGWNDSWGLRAGEQTVWSLMAQGWSGPGTPFGGQWADNTVYIGAQRSGQITP